MTGLRRRKLRAPRKNVIRVLSSPRATGWLVALLGFKLELEASSLPPIALGGLLWVTTEGRRVSDVGRLALGLGLLLLALGFMK